MSFKAAVAAATTPLDGAYQPGKQALGGHSPKVHCEVNARITGSVEVDETVRALFPQENRWDYGVGYVPPGSRQEFAIWIEVHSAHTSEVSVMLKKKDWLRRYLADHCGALWAMTPKTKNPHPGFVWVSSNGNQILKHSPQARQLAVSGIAGPVRVLKLP